MSEDLRQRNKKVMCVTLGVVCGMVAMSFAFVPLYRMICQVTGWGGTTQRTAVNASKVYDREMTVQFNTDVDKKLPWNFEAEMRQVTLKVGADAFVSFLAENKSDKPVGGVAVFNVTPLKAGKYFHKTQCFCFGGQVLQPGQRAHMPVTFFIDPKIMDDYDLRDLKTITLSYTFYRHDSEELEKAMEKFYNEAPPVSGDST